jgi:hypothetical protein
MLPSMQCTATSQGYLDLTRSPAGVFLSASLLVAYVLPVTNG